MVRRYKPVIWDEEARRVFREAIAFIKSNSPQNAEKIRKDIFAATKKLVTEPVLQHAPDKYRLNNDGSYRAFELHKFRISYFTGEEAIRIVRFRHTSQQPEMY